jgi:hypothetical protein
VLGLYFLRVITKIRRSCWLTSEMRLPSWRPHLLQTIITAFTASLVTLLSWAGYNILGKPLLDARDNRNAALLAGERDGLVGYAAPQDRIASARAALSAAASPLRSTYRGQAVVRWYCRLLGYDFEKAALILFNLHNMTGDLRFSHERRQDVIDALYVYLRADKHLSAERIRAIKQGVEDDIRRQNEEAELSQSLLPSR